MARWMAPSSPPQVLAVPADAVLTTGQRQLVYVEKEPGKYQLVEPKLGPRAGDYYPVLSGLKRARPRGHARQFPPRLAVPNHRPGQPALSGRLDAANSPVPIPRRASRPKSRRTSIKLPATDRELAVQAEDLPDHQGQTRLDGRALQDGRPMDDRSFCAAKAAKAQVKADPAAALKKLESVRRGHRQARRPLSPGSPPRNCEPG